MTQTFYGFLITTRWVIKFRVGPELGTYIKVLIKSVIHGNITKPFLEYIS